MKTFNNQMEVNSGKPLTIDTLFGTLPIFMTIVPYKHGNSSFQ